ncbi:uncharacterized protein M6B38_144815 [Iris pallida]|uniref:Metallo-beta-lactamase domain-containing protein n=1 Tax=Iris pallida TaxID=29817 RepID=A0AAX6FAL0_IRIPA|nr:uncharacterized protein M6B38_144815 [Iris pallida]
MPEHLLAVAIERSSAEEFLAIKQDRPPALPEEEYRRFVDSDLWDLPSAPLRPLRGGGLRSEIAVGGADSVADKLDLSSVDVDSALNQVLSQVGIAIAFIGKWTLLKHVEEPDFGPGAPVHTLFILGKLESEVESLQDSCKWLSKEIASKLLLEVTPNSDRIGPLVVTGLLHSSLETGKWRAPHALHFQEYPPGVMLVPMRSRTQKPFRTTNLIVMVPNHDVNISENFGHITAGDALLVDPGCCSQFHKELADLVAALPRKLVVFVTHHHNDHIDGLSVVQRCNPDAILLAHTSTMNRIGKEMWSHGYTSISGGENISIGGQRLEAIFAPGHTDGHLSLLHVSTNSLIVGDHCVGHGSAVLDVTSGGNMKDYFQTTYRFMELSPHALIPMHGRINLWPKRMLCGYLKHRRDRESLVMAAIESGAETLYDIVSKVYADVDTKLWLAASFNVRVHVAHLAYQEKLPKDFSMKNFEATCGMRFLYRWAWGYLISHTPTGIKVLAVIGATGFVLSFAVTRNLG